MRSKKKSISASRIFANNFFLFRYIRKFVPGFFAHEVFNAILGGIISSMYTIYAKLFYDAISSQKNIRYILIMSGVFLIIDVLVNLLYFSYYRTIKRELYLSKLKYAMNKELFEVTRKLDYSCYDKSEFYNEFVWALNQSDSRAVGMIDSLTQLLRNSVRIVTIFSILFSVSWYLSMIAITLAIVSIIISKKVLHISVHRNEVLNPLQRREAYYERIFSRPETAKEVRITHISKLIMQKYDKTIDDIECITRKSCYRVMLFALPNEVLSKITEPLVYMLLLFQVMVQKTAELGGLAVAVSSFWGVRYSLEDILKTMLQFEEHALYAEKMRKLLEYQNTVLSGELPCDSIDSITFRNVSFGYSMESEILHNINFTINRGEKIALVGYNGAGKTTLIKLLLRFYDPSKGEILITGKDLRAYDLESYWKRIGAVFQDYQLLAMSVAENVVCDVPTSADMPKVVKALEKTKFLDKLQELPNGVQTELTKEFFEEGTNLSGGESQKVAIARLFCRNFDLLVLDEPSSSLDPVADHHINCQFKLCDETVICISHRLSTTRDADCIYMLENGCIIEHGSHDFLMNQNGKYANMFRVQAEKYGE